MIAKTCFFGIGPSSSGMVLTVQLFSNNTVDHRSNCCMHSNYTKHPSWPQTKSVFIDHGNTTQFGNYSGHHNYDVGVIYMLHAVATLCCITPTWHRSRDLQISETFESFSRFSIRLMGDLQGLLLMWIDTDVCQNGIQILKCCIPITVELNVNSYVYYNLRRAIV